MLSVKAEETSVVIYQSITKVEFPGLLSSNFYLYIILCVYLPLGRFSRTLDSTMSHRVFKTFSFCHMERHGGMFQFLHKTTAYSYREEMFL